MGRATFLQYFATIFLMVCVLSNSFSQEEIEEDSVLSNLVFLYATKGFNYLQFDYNLDTAEYYLKRALDLQTSSNRYIINERVANTHVLLASFYRRIFNISEAIYHLDEAERILKEKDPNNLLFGDIYHNKGNLYKVRNDVFRTKEYYEYALDFVTKIGYKNSPSFSFILSNYTNLLFEIGEYELAEELLSRMDISKLDVSPEVELRIHLTNAVIYSKLNQYNTSTYHFNEARKLFDKYSNNEISTSKMTYYYNIIDFYIYYDQYEEALIQGDEALLFIESLDSHAVKNKAIYFSNIYYRIASIYFRSGNNKKALTIVKKGIETLKVFFDELSYQEGTITLRNEFQSALPELYILQSQILLDNFKDSNSIEDLKSSFTLYKKAIETLDYMKLSMQNEDSKVYATSQILEVYNEAIYVGMLLYELTSELNYLEQSFEFAESSKSFALFSEIKKIEAMEFSGLPAEIKAKEERIVGEIQHYEENLYQEQLLTAPDITKIKSLKDNLFHLNADYDKLMHEIEVNYSRYYEFKYKPKFITLEQVKRELPYRDALIEYVLTDTMLITYVVDRKGINVFSQHIGPEFASECLEYYELLYKQNFSTGVHENYKRFVTLGRKFYHILIEPCLQYTDRKSFTIVPDGAISYLPFEGLLTKDTDSEYINYMVLPYMIREFSVGYSYSSTLMFNARLKTKSPENKVLAFAPGYIDTLDYTSLELLRQSKPELNYLAPLRGVIKEVQSINETVPSRVFLNEKATEASFKKYASDYNVLHLAMHTIMMDDEPLYSYLAFTNLDSGDTIEDNKLYAYEIYNLKLNAQMAVLSSCSSGFGKMQKGEGMMSLARGFIYAGCPSIVMTLWQVSDQPSSELMTSFYKYLKKGKSKQEAMRQAKIDYLETADDLTSNPYFWSGFVVVGDGHPVYRKSGVAYWMIIISLFIGILVFFQYRKS